MGSNKNKRSRQKRVEPKRLKSGFLTIPLPLYHLHVVVAYGVTAEACYKHAKKHGCDVDEKWLDDIKRGFDGANGFCSNLGHENRDILIWLPKALYEDSRCSEYGTLVHEIYHAVDKIRKHLWAEDEMEFGAYIMEYLFEQVCKEFWKNKRPKRS